MANSESEQVSLVRCLGEIAARHPELAAAVDGEGRLTYRELDVQANAVAHRLAAVRREGDNYVIVMLPRTRHFPIVALGALKAGVAYVPVNPAYPRDRVNVILGETKPVAFVTTGAIWAEKGDGLDCGDATVIKLDATDWAAEDTSPIDLSSPDQRAMVLYTSGTTGKPKGVVHPLRSLVAMSHAVPHDVVYEPGTRYALVTDFSFIATAFLLYECLMNGGECHLIDDEMRMDMMRLAAYFAAHDIAITFMGSSMGVAMLKACDIRLRELWVGGEKVSGLTPETAAKTRVVNVYGMTELAPIATCVLTGDEVRVPVGTAHEGTVYVLDDEGRPAKPGEIGEVYTDADRMALEYLAMPELSAKRFLENPFTPGRRLLRTGDRGYFDEAGRIVLCGRTDDMVKLRGLRIETGEIEVVAQTYSGMNGCACVVKQVNGEDQLCLYFENEQPVELEGLKAHLARKLAVYMIPAMYVQMDRLPRNARGKIDRKRLPEPLAGFKAEKVPPASDHESILLGLATKTLGTAEFGVTDDLFAMGLSSLASMKFVSEAAKLGVRLKTSDLMRYKTIRGVLHHSTHIAEWYDGFDPAKDVVIFCNGISLTKNVDRKLKMWAAHYNVLTIEPIQEHYRYIFEGDDIAEVVAFYFALVDWYVPAGTRIRVCTGVSWGGILAYRLACAIRDASGQRPTVVLGDSLIEVDPTMSQALLDGKFGEWLAERHLDPTPFNADFVRRQTILAKVEQRKIPLPTYDGRVILLHALDNWVFPAHNDEKWRKLVTNLTIVPINTNHNMIAVDTDLTLPVWETVEKANRLWDRMLTGEAEMKAVYDAEIMPRIERETDETLARLEPLAEPVEPTGTWKEIDGGMDSFHVCDAGAEDARRLFVPKWPLRDECFAWWMAMFRGPYLFRPAEYPAPKYNLEIVDGTLTASVPAKNDAWVYLISKRPCPPTFRLEFDYLSHQAMEETIQLCFAFESLASRFRYDLYADNRLLVFDIVKGGMFMGAYNHEKWLKGGIRKPYSMRIGEWVHVRLEAIGNVFQLFFDEEPAMAMRVRGYEPKPSPWVFIAWSGFKEQPMKIQLKNVKVYGLDE